MANNCPPIFFFIMNQQTIDFNKCVRTILTCETKEQMYSAIEMAKNYKLKYNNGTAQSDYSFLIGLQSGRSFEILLRDNYDNAIKLLNETYPVEDTVSEAQ